MERDFLIKLFSHKKDYIKIINCQKSELFDKIREFLAINESVDIFEEYLTIGEYELYIYTLDECDYLDFLN